MVTAQYAETHLSQLLSAADNGEVVEIARPDKPTIHLVMASDPKESKPRPIGRRLLFGAGEGKIALPTDEEDRAMDKEIEDLMLNGPIFPPENA